MDFRRSYRAGDVTITGRDPIALTVRRQHDFRVHLTSLDEAGQPQDTLSCLVEVSLDPPDAIVGAFHSLADDRLPVPPPHEEVLLHDYIDQEGKILGNHIAPLHLMPPDFREFAESLSGEVHDVVEAVVGVARWRSRTFGQRHPFSASPMEWMLDGAVWKHMPTSTGVQIGDVARIEFTEASIADLQALLDADTLEPLAHALFREAWSQRYSNPDSALLIGVAALEIGVKQYIGACVPAATWLAENVPSPPLVKMIQNYLPTLQSPVGLSFAKLEAPLPGIIGKAVEMRNALAHKGSAVDREGLSLALRAIRNVLWRLDVVMGQSWATDHESPLDHDPDVGYRRI